MTPQQTLSPRAWAELSLLSLIWGGTFLSTRVALEALGPLTVVAHRVSWAAIALWFFVVIRKRPVQLSPKILIGFAGMGLLNNILPFSLQAWGQLHIETGLTSILNAGTAVWGVLVAAIFFADERLSSRKIIGVSLGFLGVATAVGLSALASFDLRSTAQLAVVLSTVSYAFAGVWARVMLRGLDPVFQAAGMLTASTCIAIPMATVVEGPISLAMGYHTWMAIAYLTLIATAGAYLLYYRVLGMAGSGNVMLCTLLIAPIAIVLGSVFLGETLQPQAFVGFGILAVGLLVLANARR